MGRKRRKDFIPLENIENNRFGKLTVLREADTDKRQSGCRILYECKCDCGNHTFASRWELESGHKTRCEYCSAMAREPTKAYDRSIQINNTSGYRGVDFHSGAWRARITIRNKTHTLGEFETIAEAIAARLSAEKIIKFEEEMIHVDDKFIITGLDFCESEIEALEIIPNESLGKIIKALISKDREGKVKILTPTEKAIFILITKLPGEIEKLKESANTVCEELRLT